MKDLELLVNGFINSQLSMNDYIKRIKKTSIDQNFLINYKETNLMDQRMNALLIIWMYHSAIFKEIDYTNNPYLSYIYELTSDIDQVDINYINLETNYLVANINNFYFIINHNNHEINIELPNELKNQKVFCYNCNDDMNLKEQILLPEFSFYVLEV